MKKIFIISAVLFTVMLLFFGVYTFVFRKSADNPTADAGKKQALETAAADAQKKAADTKPPVINTVFNDQVFGAEFSPDGTLVYFSITDHSFKRYDLTKKESTTILGNLPGRVMRLVWSPDRIKALALIEKDGRSTWYTVDMNGKTITPLKPEMNRLAWTFLGNQILYIYSDSTKKSFTLNVSDPDGKNWKVLANLSNDSFISAIPQSSLVSFWTKTSGLSPSTLEAAGIVNGEGRKTLLQGKFGGDYLWSPNGERALVSFVTDKGGSTMKLGVIDRTSGKFLDLGLPTMISKAVWSSDNHTVYFALPGNLPDNIVLPDDYFGKSIPSEDTFLKIDLDTLKQDRIVDLSDIPNGFDSTNLLLAPKGDTLFFVERTSHKLYQIGL